MLYPKNLQCVERIRCKRPMQRYSFTTWGFRRSRGCFILATKRAEEEEKNKEKEEGWKTCRSSDFCSPDSVQLRKPLSEPQPPFPCSLSNQIHGDAHKLKLYLSWSAAGSQKRDGKSTTSHGSSSCGREDSLLPTQRGQIHPQLDTTRGFGGHRGSAGFFFLFSPFR